MQRILSKVSHSFLINKKIITRTIHSNIVNMVQSTYFTSDPTKCVEIRYNQTEAGSIPAKTVIEVFQEAVHKYGDHPAVSFKTNFEGQLDKNWSVWTWKEYYEKCQLFAKSLIHLGIEPHKVINIIGFNSAPWLCANTGAILGGIIPAGIYTTNSPEACLYIAKHSKVELIVVENNIQFEKYINDVKEIQSTLKAFIMYSETPNEDLKSKLPNSIPIYTFDEFLELGQNVSNNLLSDRYKLIKPGHCASLIYTSGTTGTPKATMISHDNITWSAKILHKYYTSCNHTDRFVSYLPLSHITAQLVDVHSPMCLGACTYMAQPDALKGSLIETLKEVKPTIFFGVPRVWEKMAERMQTLGKDVKGLKKVVSTWAKKQGLEHNMNQIYGKSKKSPLFFPLADKLVLSQIRKALGLDETHGFYTGSAPISPEVVEYFASLNMPIFEGFGMSECAGTYSLATKTTWKIGHCGRPLKGTYTKIDPDTNELLIQGRNVFMGYMYDEKATQNTLSSDGFLHTGDIASIDSENDPDVEPPSGFVKIVGRIKELIITSGGENMSPTHIENLIKLYNPAVSNCMLIGDQKKYLTVLITLKCEINTTTNQSTSQLSPLSLDVGKKIGSSATTIEEAVNDPKWKEYINEKLEEANKHAISHAQRVQKWTLLLNDFSELGGELTPTMKLKRNIVIKKYHDVIEKMYSE